jgi:parallel beta-helix repeat protein
MKPHTWVRQLPMLVKGMLWAVALSVAAGLVVWFVQPQPQPSPNAPQPSQGNPAPSGPRAPVLIPPTVGHALPDAAPVRCPAPGIRVSNAEELTAALGAAKPGTSIFLADGVYTGNFVAATSGTADRPIWLCGGPGAVLDGGNIKKGYVLHLNGVAFWRVVGFTVRNGQKGVMADATASSVIQDLDVYDIGDEAIHLRATSTSNAVLNNRLHSTGLLKPKFGEGIYVGSAKKNMRLYSPPNGPDRSDSNLIAGNTIHNTTAESIDIKEGTSGGLVRGNTFDGTGMTAANTWVNVKGNGWMIEGNRGTNSPVDGFQSHQIMDGWGTRNTFRNNIVEGGVPGLGIHLTPVLANVIACNNRNANGSLVSTNSTCAG